MKIRSSTKIAIGAVLVIVLGFGGYRLWVEKGIEGSHFSPVVPSAVNLVGIDPGSGYRIIVANYVAQLVQTSDKFGGNESSSEGATEGAIKKRIPIREMLAVLRGDESALGPLTMTMNDIKEDALPPVRVVWTADNLKKAIDGGDAKLKEKLETDLNVHLDGSPMDKVRPSSLENGIVIDAPVTIRVNVEGTTKTLTGHVLEPYKPRLVKAVEAHYADKNYTPEMQAGYYKEEAERLVEKGSGREDVRKSLLDRISESTAKDRAEPVERVLRSATVVVNDSHIRKASYKSYDTSDGERSDLTIELTDEGSRRLWKYSLDRVNTQLLLIANGVAIEAPRIQHVLREGELTITQMRDKTLVKDAVNMINEHTAPNTK